MNRRSFVVGVIAAATSGTRAFAAADPVQRLRMSDGASIAFEAGGSGPSLILVHGAGSFLSIWAGVVPLLRRRFHTIAIDRRGHGDSSDGLGYSLAREADDLAEIAATLPPPVFAVGHSFGAIVVIEAIRRRAGFTAAALYEPPLAFPGGVGQPDPQPVCAAVAQHDDEGALLRFYAGFAGLPAAMIESMKQAPSWPRRVGLAPTVCRELRALRDYRFDAVALRRSKARMLFMRGGESSPAVASSTQQAASALGMPITTLAGQRQDAMYAAPALFADTVARFLLR